MKLLLCSATLLLAEMALLPAQASAQAAPSAQEYVEAGIAAYSRDNNRSAARTAFLKAIELDPKQAAARFNLAMLAEQEERWSEAIRYYGEYSELVGLDDLYLGIAQRKVTALTRFAELDATPEGKADRIYLQFVQRAQAKLVSGDAGAALALAELAVVKNAERFEGHLVKGGAQIDLEAYADAQKSFQAALALAPAESRTEINNLLQRARKLQASTAKVTAGDLAFTAKNYAAAADAYGQAWTLTDQPEYGFQSARAWSLAGEPAKALKIYDVLANSADTGIAAAAQQERGQVSLLAVNAGSSDPLKRPEYARAIEHINAGRFYEADAQITLLLDGLMPGRDYSPLFEARGVARKALNEFGGALSDFTVAMLLDPSRAAIYERRAAAFAALKRFGEAAADISSAMERSPANDQPRLRALRDGYSARVGK